MRILGNRMADILRFVDGKTVLDMGCVGLRQVSRVGGWDFLHGAMCTVAKRVVGVDYDERGIADMVRAGYDARVADIDKPFDLGEKFDTVVAIALVEHLSNPGVWIDNTVRHLLPGGKMIATAHNPQALEFFFEQAVWGEALHKTDCHANWESPLRMKFLLETHGMKIEEVRYFHTLAKSKLGKVFDIVTLPLPMRFARSITYITSLNGAKPKQ